MITGIQCIGGLTRLRQLSLWNCMRISEDGLNVLRHLPGLQLLSLRGCQQVFAESWITAVCTHLA